MAKELPKRSEVKVEDTWKTEDIYASRDLWEEDLKHIAENGEKLAALEGKLNDANNLYDALHINEDIEYVGGRLFGYAARESDVDTGNADNQKLVMRARTAFVKIGEQAAFMEPEILALPDGTLDKFYEEKPELKRYKIYLDNMLRTKAHTLTPELEKLMASTSDAMGSFSTAFSMFNNADLVFPEITNEDGEKERLTHGRYVPFLESGNREVRKAAFEAMYKTYEGFKNTLSTIYAGHLKTHYFNAKTRKYDSCLEAAVDGNNVPKEVYKNLIEAVHANLDKMYRYVRLRKKVLGVDELHMYDLYTPLVKDSDAKISFEEAKKTVLEALAPLGKDYTDVIEEGFNNRWIDVYENEGKRSGAYSAGIPGCHPFVLLNHSGTLDSMFTLAHEMGHAMHSYLSQKNQPFIDSQYVIFVAEVASTCNEVLLVKHLLSKTTDKSQRAYLINHFLESFRGTVYRQTMFAEFELMTHEAVERGESLTPDVLCDMYYELNKKYFGDDIVVDKDIAMEWARIPHFYYNFYVYQYATGFSAAVALAEKILSEGAPAVENYKKFLSGGCSKSPIELLRIAGVDMASPEPVNAGLKLFEELLGEMEALVE